MRILALVSDAFGGHGGIAKFNRDLLTALCGMPGVEQVTAVPRLMPDPPGDLPAKLRLVVGGVGGKLRYAWTVLKSAITNRQSAIILCGHINLLPVAFAARWFCRAPVVLVIHGTDAWQPTRSWLVNRLARKLDAVVSVSGFTQKKFLAWARPADARSFILPNCVDLARFTPGPKNPELLERHGLRDRTVLLTVARLSAQEQGWKGLDEVIELLPQLAKRISNLSYLIVGDGTDRARLARKAAELGIQERVIFAGRISEEAKADYYRLADAFVMAGRVEGFGIVYLEAMACGVPVVGSKVDGSCETLRNGELGIVVNPGNKEEILQGILSALERGTGTVPKGLDDYSIQNFRRRCQEIVAALTPGKGSVAR